MRLHTHLAITALVLSLLPASDAFAQISVRSPLSDDRFVEPGTQYGGQILVKNETDKSQQARIYQTDYRFYADGSNFYGEPGKDERSNADWMRLSASIITLPPREIVPVEYIVSVPAQRDSTSLEGSYWNMIMVEAVPEGSAESTLLGKSQENDHRLKQVLRYGIQVATHIEGSGHSSINIDQIALSTGDDHRLALSLRVKNEGNKFLRPEVWLEVYSDSGEYVDRFDGAQSRIYPDTSVRQQFDLGELGSGTYRALLILDGGEDELFGSELDLVID